MTTTVIVDASCASEKEVQVSINDTASENEPEVFTLQDGESSDRTIYDGLEISVKEVLKDTTSEPGHEEVGNPGGTD